MKNLLWSFLVGASFFCSTFSLALAQPNDGPSEAVKSDPLYSRYIEIGNRQGGFANIEAIEALVALTKAADTLDDKNYVQYGDDRFGEIASHVDRYFLNGFMSSMGNMSGDGWEGKAMDYAFRLDEDKSVLSITRDEIIASNEANSEIASVKQAKMRFMSDLNQIGVPSEVNMDITVKVLMGRFFKTKEQSRIVSYLALATPSINGEKLEGRKITAVYKPSGLLRKLVVKWPPVNECRKKLVENIDSFRITTKIVEALETHPLRESDDPLWLQPALKIVDGEIIRYVKVVGILRNGTDGWMWGILDVSI